MVLDFMNNGLDVVDDYMKIRVAEKFREQFPTAKDTMTRYARTNIYEQYLYFIKEWEIGIVNPKPLQVKPMFELDNKITRIKELNGGGVPKYKRNYDRYKSKKNMY
jgi:hypothetical protein